MIDVLPNIRHAANTFNRGKEEPDNGYSSTKHMNKEINRLNSFSGWPLTYIAPISLANSGFYFTHKKDLVRCAFCHIEVGDWEEGDDAMSDHRKWSSQCPFVKGLNCGNISMSESPNDNDSIASNEGQDTCGKYGIHLRPNSYAENEEPHFQKLGVQPSRGPAYAAYAIMEKRLQSYSEWPISIKQTPAELAEAGFYYTGKGDQTVCFYCGGGLKDWEGNDDPWEQHARWFTKCNFVILKKGQEYVNNVTSKSNNEVLLTPEQAEALSVPNTSNKSIVQKKEIKCDPAKETTSSESSPAVVASTKDSEEPTSKSTLCKICYTKEVGVVFLPCGHMVACVDCAPALSKCAVCRCDLEATVRAFLS